MPKYSKPKFALSQQRESLRRFASVLRISLVFLAAVSVFFRMPLSVSFFETQELGWLRGVA